MINYPNIDPIALSIGPLSVRWYGITYLLGLAVAWLLGSYRINKFKHNKHYEQFFRNFTQLEFSDLLLYTAFGLLLGGRLGYMLFYKTSILLTAPWDIFKIWQGGMSFHGGLIGAVIGILVFCKQYKIQFFELADFLAPLAPPAFLFGRIGNFINGELWGRLSDVPWAMIFPHADNLPRHPTQLYEGMLEGLTLFLILWFFTNNPDKRRPTMSVSGLFLICYGLFRCFVEYFREPDQHLGYIAFNWLTMGQILSIPMIIFGIILFISAYRNK